jgi:hypothetical protein
VMRATFGRLAAVRSLLLLRASTGSSSSCPGDYAEQMESLCGAAKAASAGNCFVCLAQHSQFRGCAGAAFDSYCLGAYNQRPSGWGVSGARCAT